METLQEVAGPSYPVLFLKAGVENWTPVGDEDLCSVVEGKGGTAAVVVCDSDGNAKAISGWVLAGAADRFASTLESIGIRRYGGRVKLPI